MRHMIVTVSLLILGTVQGAALADPLKIPGPPPTAGGSCPALAECEQSLSSCQQDVETLLPALAKCEGTDVDTIKKKYDIGDGGTTVKVVKRTPRKPRKPSKPKPPATSQKGDKGDKGDQGEQGEKGDRGTDGLASLIDAKLEPKGVHCKNGGQHLLFGLDDSRDGALQDEEVDTDVYICNGKDGEDGEKGRDGYSRIQLYTGVRAASIHTADRPDGWSVAPSLGLKYWLSPTVEFNLDLAWAPGDDRNMVVTGQVCRRANGSMLGLCFGGQYIGWNLEGGLALWHSGTAQAAVKLVPFETRHVDLSFEAGGGIGFDGYDEDMQLAGSLTAQGALTVKF